MNLIIIGPQGSGKGTQAKLISARYNLRHISTGAALRRKAQENSPQGRLITSIFNKGKLVPFSLVLSLIELDLLSQDGFILDGTPRNLEQAKDLEYIFHENKISLTKVLNLILSREESVRRLLHRAQTEGRSDDNLDSINIRLTTFERDTKPVIDYYRAQNLVIDIDGSPDVETIHKNICSNLDHLGS